MMTIMKQRPVSLFTRVGMSRIRCQLLPLAVALLCCTTLLQGQDTWYGTVSGMQMMYNPGFFGSEGTSSLRLSAFSFMPGKGYGLRSAFAAWDGYYDALHGGAGIWASGDQPGDVMSDFRAGAGYAYHFRAGRDLYLSAGLTASVISRGVKSGAVILPGDIDPFRGIITGTGSYLAREPVTRFDLGTGFTLAAGNWYAGGAVMHLTRPSLGESGRTEERIDRLWAATGGVTLPLQGKEMTVTPSAAVMVQGNEIRIAMAAEATWKTVTAGISGWHVTGGFTAAGVALGWDMSVVRLNISYSYFISGGDALFAGTAIVRAGAHFTFINIEKSRAAHIIKMPLL